MRRELPDKLNVCMVSRGFSSAPRSSGHSALWLVARGLAAQGHSVSVLSTHPSFGQSTISVDGVAIHYLGTHSPRRRTDSFRDTLLTRFAELHRARPFDILHSVDAAALSISQKKQTLDIAVAYDIEATQVSQLFAAGGLAEPTVSSLLRTSMTVGYRFLTSFLAIDRKVLKTADGVFVTSPQQRLVLERYYLYPDARIHLAPYGMEIGDLSEKGQSESLREKLNITESTKTVVAITDMNDVFEMRTLLQAFTQVVIKKPNCRLIIIGMGPKFKEVEYEMLMLAVGSKVVLAGEIPASEISDYIGLSDVFVNLSARTTGFEPSLLEAMAQKKIIIGSEVSPISTIVEHAQDGFLIRPADVDELSSLLFDIFSENLNVSEIGENARKKITNLFDTEKMVTGIVQAYRKILFSTGRFKNLNSRKISAPKNSAGPTTQNL